MKTRGALLSLSLDLEAPAGSRSQEFTTLAASDDGAVPALDVSYASRSFREVIVLILAAGLALLMWWLRHATAKTKLLLVLLTIVVPVALAPITPAWGMMIVEGLLLGGMAGVLLWTLLAVVACASRMLPSAGCPPWWTAKTPANTTAGLFRRCLAVVVGRSRDCPGSEPGHRTRSRSAAADAARPNTLR